MNTADIQVLVTEPAGLTAGEKELFEWAISAMENVAEDEDFQLDNPDWATDINDQRCDLCYRLFTQAKDLAEDTDNMRSYSRVANGLKRKLATAWGWTVEQIEEGSEP